MLLDVITWIRGRMSQLRNRIAPPSAEAVFADIYRHNRWRSADSRSGPGSSLEATAPLRAALETFANAQAFAAGRA